MCYGDVAGLSLSDILGNRRRLGRALHIARYTCFQGTALGEAEGIRISKRRKGDAIHLEDKACGLTRCCCINS